MISVNNIKKEFSGNTLFENVTFNINPKERIGLAGKNGSGKTTLLNIIAGNLEPDEGQIVKPVDLGIGYLPQEKSIDSKLSILDEVMRVFEWVEKLENRNREIEALLAGRDDYDSDEFQKLIGEQLHNRERIDMSEPDKVLGKAERILLGLGFKREEFNMPLNTFSLGWQMRVEIAKLLLENPFLLLLDEPTNHLDIDSISWLENYLLSYTGAVVIVSHDRTLLDNLTNRTIEINHGKIYDYKVPYSGYIRLRGERLEQQLAALDNQQREIRDIERFIERFRYKASKARQVQSRIKHLEKMDRVKVDDMDNAGMHFSFPPAPHSGKITVEGKKIQKQYGDKRVLDSIDFQVLRGEKIAFVGRNGEGKSTLAKIIAGQLEHNGSLVPGHQVTSCYYSQDQWDMLDPERTVFETLDDVAVGDIRKRLKSILGAFLFSGETVDKKVKVLSGGEKARLALAKLLLVPSNLVILDEPTNHLDILSKDILKNALIKYDGTLIVVSHDRDFLQGLTDRLYEFKNHTIKEFRGDIFEFLEKRKITELKELEKAKAGVKLSSEQVKKENRKKWEHKKEFEKKLRKLTSSIKVLEGKIGQCEQEIQELADKLSMPEKYEEGIKSGELYRTHGKLNGMLEKYYHEWEEQQLQKESVKNKLNKLVE